MGILEDVEQMEKAGTGSFAGFVLLAEDRWDKEQFKQDLKNIWGIEACKQDEGGTDVKNSDSFAFSVDNMDAVVSLMPAPVPDHEAEKTAANNYMWPCAMDNVRAHKAHLLVAVLGQDAPLLERGKLFVKVMSACCRQQGVLGVYTRGAVFQPEFYQGFSEMMLDGKLPVFNWIWFGMHQNERGVSAYTYGMDVFGKDEMEVLDSCVQPGVLRDFLSSIAAYVLEEDVVLEDGETIGFSKEQHLSITRSEGVFLPGMTLKIGYMDLSGEQSYPD